MGKYVKIKGFLRFFMLHELAKKPRSGDELAARVGKRKQRILTPGTIYPALKQLKKQKLIMWKRNGRRKVYRLTPQGKKELRSLYTELKTYFKGIKSYL